MKDLSLPFGKDDMHKQVNEKIVSPEKVMKGAGGLYTELVIIGRRPDGEVEIASSHQIKMAIELTEAGLKDLKGRID